MIPMQFALRRRMMNMIPLTVTLTGDFDNSGSFGERYVVINGEIITALGTYTVPYGSTITLHTKISPVMGGNEKYGIFVNGKCVRTALQCINHGPDYEYTVTCNCTINGQGKVHDRGGYARIDVTTNPIQNTAISNLPKEAQLMGIISRFPAGATKPYIEEIYNSDGQLISANMYGYDAIRDYAFYNCTSLALTSLPNGITNIGHNAFAECSSLALTSLPSGITNISAGAFNGCTSLALTSLPSSITNIGDYAFVNCTSLALTTLPSGITNISAGAFNGCTSLALTSLPNGITNIGSYAFWGCSSLALTTLPSGITSIGGSAFDGCTNLALTSLPSGITNIGGYAFAGCSSLASLIFEGTPESIADSAFAGCNNLTTINVPWAEGAVANAPWGATNATINYGHIS